MPDILLNQHPCLEELLDRFEREDLDNPLTDEELEVVLDYMGPAGRAEYAHMQEEERQHQLAMQAMDNASAIAQAVLAEFGYEDFDY